MTIFAYPEMLFLANQMC